MNPKQFYTDLVELALGLSDIEEMELRDFTDLYSTCSIPAAGERLLSKGLMTHGHHKILMKPTPKGQAVLAMIKAFENE